MFGAAINSNCVAVNNSQCPSGSHIEPAVATPYRDKSCNPAETK